MTGIAGTQVYSIIHSCNISWEEATLRRKALPLLMEWDAACPHTQVNAMLQLSCCLTRGCNWPPLLLDETHNCL